MKSKKLELKTNYDSSDPLSIEKYSKKLIDKTFESILFEYFKDDNDEFLKHRDIFNNPYRKGSLGNLIEEYFFGYLPNNSPNPDFPEAGVELKVTPYEVTKTGITRAGERLVLGMISNTEPVEDIFEDSTVYSMLQLILLVLYYRDKKEKDRIKHRIHYSQLISLNSEILKKDLEIIKSDYLTIIEKIKSGKAHELSEADTMYLAASTKGSTAKKSLQPQYYNPEIVAKRRAFSLKQGYMSSVINKYIIGKAQTYDEISDKRLSKEKFEKFVINRLKQYRGYSCEHLKEEFNLKESTSKSILSQLVLRILNVKTDNAEEFEKSNTQIKTIRRKENGDLHENMSFSTISFLEFAEEEWEESELHNFFSETRFLFVIFQEVGDDHYLDDIFFWHMPMNDLEGKGKEDWLKTQRVIRDGVDFQVRGSRVYNSIPNQSETKIFHLRPKADKAAYYIHSSRYEKGDLQKDADILPNGDLMTKQCFWLNKDYLIEKINESKINSSKRS